MERTVKASEFKARCLALMDDVAESGDTLVITKNGKPVVRVVPLAMPGAQLGFYAGRTRTCGDLIAPVGEPWDAE